MTDNRSTMKLRSLSSFFAVALVAFSSPLVSAEAQTLSDKQIDVIRQNCTQAQQILLRLQRNEAAARVNRGRGYESALRLMASFNSRVALNKLNAPKLTDITSQVETKFDEFRSHYIAYDDQLTSVLKLKCSAQPVTFYDELTLARDDRTKVAKDIQAIDNLLDQYQGAVSELKTSLTSTEGAQ